MGIEAHPVRETIVRFRLTADERARDHRFFTAMAAVCATVVFVGFAPTYYLRSFSDRPPLSPLVHLHAAVSTGWILLFPDTIAGESLVQFMYSLCEMIDAELARHIIPNLSTMPAVLGATLGVEGGNLMRMTMNEREEYVGRALNIACRLQSAVKDKEPHPGCYQALISARLYNERLAKAGTKYQVESTACSLRNILGLGRWL